MTENSVKTAKNARELFSKEEEQTIMQAIKNAELDTSGEIHIHIENKCPGDVMDRSAFLFKQLQMHKTELRNGVLIYRNLLERNEV